MRDTGYQKSPLWQKAFHQDADNLGSQRNLITAAFAGFRQRVALLVQQIHKDMPSLTVHDISHIDALWWTASEIAGPDYPLNPAEAFVLGGAFLLHDAAHCLAAYPGGVAELQKTQEWTDFAAVHDTEQLTPGSEAFQLVLFDVLRTLHPKQARKLAKLSWQAPGDITPLFLLPHDDLRAAYADVIGQVAESHWSSPHELEVFKHQQITPPVCLQHTRWNINVLKLAVLLRTADAAHFNEERAPRFLFAVTQPSGSSLIHWQFQSRMHQVQCDPDPERHDLRVSGTPFPAGEQDAWWLAYDAVRLIDNELRAADRLLYEHGIDRLAARSVAFAYSPEAFANMVPSDGWQPVDTAIKITNIKSMVEQFGGKKLYGDDPAMALRELLQNAVDAIHACRKLGYLSETEGEIEVAVDDVPEGHWLHVTDTGIGMSRYVLTEVLLDFGRSLWRSADLRGEWSGLQSSGFEAIGQFGIGFFAAFMLGERVKVLTRRCEQKEDESNQWLLDFTAGTNQRPILRKPDSKEQLKRHGTRVSVLLSKDILLRLCPKIASWPKDAPHITLQQACARLAPALDIDLFVRPAGATKQLVVEANDWLSISSADLLQRIAPSSYKQLEQSKFGPWTHLDEIRDHSGKVVGRCAIQAQTYFLFSGDRGVVVIKGLLAGSVHGFEGIAYARQQTDLARKTAVPDVSVEALQKWAEHQKLLLSGHQAINEKNSALLACCGASRSDLALGKLGGKLLTSEEFVSKVKDLSELFVHDGEISHDDDDDVRRREFNDAFEPKEPLFEFEKGRMPDWLDKIADASTDRTGWSLRRFVHLALIAAWGDYEEKTGKAVVGEVNDTEIVRELLILRPIQEEDRDPDNTHHGYFAADS